MINSSVSTNNITKMLMRAELQLLIAEEKAQDKSLTGIERMVAANAANAARLNLERMRKAV